MSGYFSDLSPEAGLAIGIIVGLLSTCVQSIGLTLQRKSHMLEDENAQTKDVPHRPSYRRRRWQIGMLLFLLANIIGSTIQITTLPLPLLSTLQASGLVFNSIMATLLLKEQGTWKTGCGTTLVAGGAVLISFFSAMPEPSHNLRQLVALLKERSFLVWFILSLVFVCAVLIMDFIMRKCTPARRRNAARFHLVRGMSYGMISGILSAHALLLAKSAVELIVRSLADHNNQFASYQSWLLVIAFVVLALSQLYYLHLGLALISTSILYPFVFCVYNIVAILDGLIYFRQMSRLKPLHAGLIALGTVVLLAGVLALSWRIDDDEGDEHAPMVQGEIPQTLLVPGSGFVAEPEDDQATESAIDSDFDATESESVSLLPKQRSRSRKSVPRPIKGRPADVRRKRAQTLHEVSQIWQLNSEDASMQSAYGTFMPRGERRVVSEHARPRAARDTSRRKRGNSISENALERGYEAEDGESSSQSQSLTTRNRSHTMPNLNRSRSRRRRRKSGVEGGALFSDLLNMDWWRTRRKAPQEAIDDDEDVDDEPSTSNGNGRTQ